MCEVASGSRLCWQGVAVEASACATLGGRPSSDDGNTARRRAIADAQLWTRRDIPSTNLKPGPQIKGALPFRDVVPCDYLDKTLEGNSPKFACRLRDGDEVKVKFGGANGEMYRGSAGDAASVGARFRRRLDVSRQRRLRRVSSRIGGDHPPRR